MTECKASRTGVTELFSDRQLTVDAVIWDGRLMPLVEEKLVQNVVASTSAACLSDTLLPLTHKLMRKCPALGVFADVGEEVALVVGVHQSLLYVAPIRSNCCFCCLSG
jgi:hypothetical protein